MARPMPRPPPLTNAMRPCELVRHAVLLRHDYVSVKRGGRFSQEGRHRLGHVAGGAREHLRAVLEVDAGLQRADLELAPHDLLGHVHAERAVGEDELGLGEGGIDDAAVGNDARTSPIRFASAAATKRPVSISS